MVSIAFVISFTALMVKCGDMKTFFIEVYPKVVSNLM